MLSFKDLNFDNWDLVKEDVLRLEELAFPKNIRETEKEFYDQISNLENISFLAYLENKMIGNAMGSSLESQNLKWPGTQFEKEKLSHYGKYNTMYLSNIVVHPGYQKKGYGREIFSEFIRRVKEKDCTRIVAYCRPNNSLPLFEKTGGNELFICKNWFDTGEDYSYMELLI